MKTIITLAAVAAAFATAAVAEAHDGAGGHYEWRDLPVSGPRATAHRVRVWVRADQTLIATCDCSMMQADASGCNMDMLGKGRVPAAG